MAHRRAPEGDLDDIVIGIAERGGSFEAAERMVYGITQRFYLRGEYPYLGRPRDHDCRKPIGRARERLQVEALASR